MPNYITYAAPGIHRARIRVDLAEVEAFYAQDKYTLARLTSGKDVFLDAITLEDGTQIVSGGSYVSLASIARALAGARLRNWVQINRAYIANSNHVVTYKSRDEKPEAGGGKLITKSKGVLPVSRRYQPTARRLINGGTFAALLMAVALFAPSPQAGAADKTTLLPVIASVTPHPDGGCVIHYQDGSERWIAACPSNAGGGQ
ncbi:LytTR family DNA-binding domain-containing protein [Thiothrix nivea]|uniref:LytTr DNA-binding region n=1 Tax=Thiothrix nivea (strain ATCC 35100 / DSM 5205 / JP2) TaxID=870187 RepID=A0A656HBI8_THINJ|nr:LytTR family DNA-binding domain-containing protein [Thiothrix nivea]EIJ33334.1 LytTr DNA-binding region [Thiothrix nivea DSM 5205]